MTGFLLKVWRLARAYRSRLMFGVVAGVLGGLLEPLMIAVVTFVYGFLFPSTGGGLHRPGSAIPRAADRATEPRVRTSGAASLERLLR
ncbi:MAG: hypothetical protein M5U12_05185 [Verrucomicrobia bacterium]|nr:hypothetical protein [Verrucomicrobiota bacterium]